MGWTSSSLEFKSEVCCIPSTSVIRVGWSLESTARAMGPTISAEELVRRARKRCKQHRNRLAGVCQECVLTEIEQAIADEHPELDRGDMFELVLECLTGEDEPAH